MTKEKKNNGKLTKPEAFYYLQSIQTFRDAIYIGFWHVVGLLMFLFLCFVAGFVWKYF